MKVYIEPIGTLINAFSKLPGVGLKTAQRYAYKIVNMPPEEAEAFAAAILSAKKNVHYCKICGNFTDGEICDVCRTRSADVICVVKEPKDVIAIEKLNEFDGVYHVLHGTISPMDGVGPNDIRIKELLERVAKGSVKEVIMATNPDVEGEATALYINRLLEPLGVKVTRLAHGIPIGTDLEYADEVTLARAFVERKPL
ncbi:MAG: recombination mediator RecR [Firmicutes bacterium]|nr:recombination protein RecR [Clostridia bacterium]MBS6464908.1 recombination mediator RecR [Bacillota bacterium]